MRPRPNVVIRFCSIECCFSHPLATCDSQQNQAFRADMEAARRELAELRATTEARQDGAACQAEAALTARTPY